MPGLAWVVIWIILIIATIVTFVLLGLSLFRKVKSVLEEISGTAKVAEQFAAALEKAHREPQPLPIALMATEKEKYLWHQTRSQNIARRGQRRVERRQRTLRRWQEIGIPF